jgi:hypothetical protein
MHAAYNIKKIKRETAAAIYLIIDRTTSLQEENKIDGGLI